MSAEKEPLDGWQTVPFGELLLNSSRNGIYKAKLFHGRGVRVVNMGDLFAHPRLGEADMERIEVTELELERFALARGDLLFARRSLTAEGAGKCTLVVSVPEPTVFESSIIRARPDPDVADAAFLYYLFRSPVGAYLLGTIRREVAVSGVTGGDLRQLRLTLPLLAQQVEIGRLLSALDDRIEVNRRIAETLEQIARSLFASWFVDFDPVRGIAAVPEDIRRFFPDQLVESPIGSVPAGWEVVALGDLVEVTRGLSYTSAGLADEGLPLHNLDSIREGGGYKREGMKYYVGEFRERDRVRPGDVIVANTDLTQNARVIGYPAIVPRAFGDDGLYSQDLCCVRPRDGSPLTPRFLYLLLASQRMRYQVASYANGTTVLHLAMDGLRKPLIVNPPRELVECFDALVGSMFDQQEAVTAESKTLAELRDTLLPKLISGEIRLPAA